MRVFAVLGFAEAGAKEAVRCFHVRAVSVGEAVPLIRESGLADDLAELIPYPSSILDVAERLRTPEVAPRREGQKRGGTGLFLKSSRPRSSSLPGRSEDGETGNGNRGRTFG